MRIGFAIRMDVPIRTAASVAVGTWAMTEPSEVITTMMKSE